MHKEETESGPMGLHRGWVKKFRLPTDEELAQAEKDALNKKTADEDYEIYA